MATIRQRGNTWQAIVKRKGYPTQSKSFDLKKDAEKWARHQERLLDAGQWVNRTEAEQTTLRQLLDRYEKEVTIKKRGSDIELIRISVIKRSRMVDYAVASITGRMIAEYRDKRLEVVSGSTVHKELALLSNLFNIAIKDWGFALHNNPVSLIRKPAPNKARDRVLNNDQRQALITAVGQCRNPWVKPVVIFALETAARRGEILSLTWRDVDFERKVAKVSGKTGSRTIPLSPTCVAMLKALPLSLDGYVFPVTVDTLKQAYERAVARAGIKDFTFHDLRHDALTTLAKRGLNILELRAISGHTTANMLQRYVSIDATDLAAKLAAQEVKKVAL